MGLENDILAKPEECKYSDSCWIKELTTAMARFKIKIYRKNGIKLTPQRKNDITIMQLVQSQCNATECRHINTCRQYINAIFLSDIIHPCGKKLDIKYYQQTQIQSNLLWPTIPSPPQKTWNTWNTKI